MAWTDERVELLTKLWAEGLSASQIANRLGGVTRNAVIGKVHRLGLSGRTTTSRAKSSRPRRRAPSRAGGRSGGGATLRTHGNVALKPYYDPETDLEPDLTPSPIQELFIPPSERASILTLKETMCRWPIGDPGDEEFHFCGRPSDQGVPYCEFHSRVAYQPAQARRRDRRTGQR
jgi:GcrA cell cycle regulator